jgi:hypothetical protein
MKINKIEFAHKIIDIENEPIDVFVEAKNDYS